MKYKTEVRNNREELVDTRELDAANDLDAAITAATIFAKTAKGLKRPWALSVHVSHAVGDPHAVAFNVYEHVEARAHDIGILRSANDDLLRLGVYKVLSRLPRDIADDIERLAVTHLVRNYVRRP